MHFLRAAGALEVAESKVVVPAKGSTPQEARPRLSTSPLPSRPAMANSVNNARRAEPIFQQQKEQKTDVSTIIVFGLLVLLALCFYPKTTAAVVGGVIWLKYH